MRQVEATARPLVPPAEGSQLALTELELAAGEQAGIEARAADTLLFAAAGDGRLELGGAEHALAEHAAALVLDGEQAMLAAGAGGLRALVAHVGPETHRHAPMGDRAVAVPLETAETAAATGSRSFQILFGPHNGCLDATLFVGFIPPGAASWHYHLYDEIVWIAAGDGRLHLGEERTPLTPGSAFRLRPQERHVVENLSATEELVVLGLFTPAGSPSAAYLDLERT